MYVISLHRSIFVLMHWHSIFDGNKTGTAENDLSMQKNLLFCTQPSLHLLPHQTMCTVQKILLHVISTFISRVFWELM